MKEKKINGKEVVIVTVSLFLICVITTALLALVSSVTAYPIEENKKAAMSETMQSVVPDASEFREMSGEDSSIYEALDGDGNVIGYAVSTSAAGYGGAVEVMTGFDLDGRIIKVAIISADDETPGLGLKVKNEEFLIQFGGKDVPLVLVTASGKTGSDNEIDAVTSATYSSKAVVNAVNEALEIYKTASGGER